MVRVRVFWPPSHETEQPPQPLQSPRAQSIAHTSSEQSRCSFVAKQATPPEWLSTSIARILFCVPPPQVTSHASDDSQSPSTQSTAHCAIPHSWVCISKAGHALPPCTGCTKVRVRVLSPPPHVTEQSPKELQSPTSQSMEQGSVLHSCVSSTRVGQASPPAKGAVRVRV